MPRVYISALFGAGAGDDTIVIARFIIEIIVGSLIGTVVFYFIIRHYVKSAQAELPLLVAAAGGNAPRGSYRTWKPLFLTLLVVVALVLGVGYWLGGK